MLKARKTPLADHFFRLYLKRSLRRHFYAIDAAGWENLSRISPTRPLVVIATHTNWWDGFIAYLLCHHIPGKAFYCMMEEKQLRHYGFFRRLGAFSVDLGHPLRAASSLKYALTLLQNPSTLLCMFPQGEMISPHHPIKLRPGIDFLSRKCPNAQILPIAFRYEFLREDRPQVLINIGQPLPGAEISTHAAQDLLQFLSTQLLERLGKEHLIGMKRLITPQLSVNKRWEKFLFRLRGQSHTFIQEN